MTAAAPVEKKYLEIVSHYESCLDRHGDSHLGVDWPRADDAARRYQVMLEVIRPDARPTARSTDRPGAPSQTVSLLDFGCGAAHLLQHLQAAGIENIDYAGLDLSPKFVELARRKFPAHTFYCADLLEDAEALPRFDYVVMNGVFTERRSLSFDEMLAYFKRLLKQVWTRTACGLAFNVMSKQVDWEREDSLSPSPRHPGGLPDQGADPRLRDPQRLPPVRIHGLRLPLSDAPPSRASRTRPASE